MKIFNTSIALITSDISADNQPSAHLSDQQHMALTDEYTPHNYSPLEVVLNRGEGSYLYDTSGKRYVDMLTAYSAVSFGHSNQRIIKRAKAQMDAVVLTSRAYYHDQLVPFCRDLSKLCGMEQVLPMNSGAEAVETAIKLARRWGYVTKGIPENTAEIICFSNNFHGRTTTIVGFSTGQDSRRGFGPFTPGFVIVPYNDLEALAEAVTSKTAAVLVEPIQGEAGVLIPDEGFLKGVREICSREKILMLADEVQTGLCRTGKVFACDHERVTPDAYILGKALGGGILPVSAVVSRKEIMQVFTPGSHGSTWGGNPLACAVGHEVISIINEEKPEILSADKGKYFLQKLRTLFEAGELQKVSDIRGRGLFIGIDIKPEYGTGKHFGHDFLHKGLLTKDTRDQTLRMAPSLYISYEDLDWAVSVIKEVLG